MFTVKENCLEYRFDGEILTVEPWGRDALRIRAAKGRSNYPGENWALLEPERVSAEITLHPDGSAQVKNGKLLAKISKFGRITFENDRGKTLLKEYWCFREYDQPGISLNIPGRDWRAKDNANYQLSVRFLPQKEKLFGMGQYQMNCFELKGCSLELAHRNCQASVPFLLSSAGYGFLWNNPAVGRATFANNMTEWVANNTRTLDYWICAGDTPAEIEEKYACATGKTPMMPEYAMGFWQSKARYHSQEEVLEVARKYKELGVPLSVLVIDYFHWPEQGEFRFDEKWFPDPKKMCEELKAQGIEPVVSVWPTVSQKSSRYREMADKGLLTRARMGLPMMIECGGYAQFIDATNEDTRKYVWSALKEGYWEKGFHSFWLDEAEPEYQTYDYSLYEYRLGPVEEIGNIYPSYYAKMVYDGLTAEGVTEPLSLIRCAWPGSQRYGSLVWSGDIESSWDSLNRQVRAGLNMAIAGIPWWTTDIGGFLQGRTGDPDFHRLLVRWMEYACFSPVFRLHGDREPHTVIPGSSVWTCAPNEIWSFGEEVLALFQKYIRLRLALKPYIAEQMRTAHEIGTPVMRPLFYEFPQDEQAWEAEDSYLFGRALLVAPVLEDHAVSRRVYLPRGTQWTNLWDGTVFAGGQTVEVDAPFDTIPVFYRGTEIPEYLKEAFAGKEKEHE